MKVLIWRQKRNLKNNNYITEYNNVVDTENVANNPDKTINTEK